MQTIQIILAALLISVNAIAQSSDSLIKSTTKKNEIGLILNPIGIVLLGATPNGQRLGVSYKRALKTPNVYFTSGLYYQGYDNSFDRGNELTIEVNGLLRNIQYRNEISNKAMLSFGMEKRWTLSSCPAVVTYVGFEYLFSYGAENVNVGSQWMKLDTSYSLEYSMQSLQPDSNYRATQRVDVTNIGAGVQFNAGIQIQLMKKFYLFAQTAPSFMFISSTRSDKNLILDTANKYKTSQFDFDMRALVADVGLFYKF